MITESKPFKDTKVGKFLTEKAPDVLQAIGGVLPDQGTLGIVKNIISRHPTLSAEDKATFEQISAEEKDLFGMEISDRTSARSREVEIVKTSSMNITQNILAYVGVLGFFCIVGYILARGLGNMNSETSFIVGNLTGLAGAIAKDIYGYYFGSSIGSRSKENIMQKQADDAK